MSLFGYAKEGWMELIPFASGPTEWDENIKSFTNKTVFHESAWLNFVAACYPKTSVEYYEIRSGADVLGYFPAVNIKKMIFTFWEGPCDGSIFMNMSPLIVHQVDQREVVKLLVETCYKKRVSHLTLCDPYLDNDMMLQLGFRPEHRVSQVCSVADGKDAVWAGMDGTCRTRIRKAEKNGVIVESAASPDFIDRFCSLYSKVLTKKGKEANIDIDYISQLFNHLWSSKRMLTLEAKHGGRVIAAAYYLHDEREMFFGNAAYDDEALSLCPNNLLHWTAMQLAVEKGLSNFYLGGDPVPSRFTRKFGGSLRPIIRYHKSIFPFAQRARDLYRQLKTQLR